jgi:putative aldouronate transport system substrate-binding protein
MGRGWKKIAALLLAAAFVLQTAACAADTKAPKETESTLEESKGVSGENKTATIKVGYAYDASFKYEGDETVDNNSWTQLYKENGIELEVIYNVESTQKDEKLSQLIMSGDYPDFISVGSSYYKDWASQGVFQDLTDYYDKYATERTKEYFETEYGSKALKEAMIDGRLYALPAVTAGYDGVRVLWIRKDWLDHLGLSEPRTVDEFYEVARAFTEDDPDGDGADNTYGIAINGKEVFSGNGGFEGYFQMFGCSPDFSFIESDGHAVYGGALSEQCKKALKLLQDMYKNGYYKPDFVTSGQEQVNQELSAGKAGMLIGSMAMMGGIWKNVLEIQPEAEFIAVPIPGETEDRRGQAFYSATTGSYYALSSKCENIEAFFKIIDLSIHYLARPDELTQEEYEKYNGKGGVYTGWQCCLAAYGNPVKNLEALDKHQNALKTGDTSDMNAENLRDFNAMQDYIRNKDRREELNEEEKAAFDSGLFFWSVWGAKQCSYAAIKQTIELDNMLESAYDTVYTDNMIENKTTLVTLAKETIIDIVMGNKDLDYYDEFLEQWNSMGGKTITEEADAWYQTQK